MRVIENEMRDDERAYYGMCDTKFIECQIFGQGDGESAFKECKRIELQSCCFALRYPLWHVEECLVYNGIFSKDSRAPMWYCRDLDVQRCKIYAPKAIRECVNVKFENSTTISEEFGWRVHGFKSHGSSIGGSYLFLDSSELDFERTSTDGKYAFQYVKNAVFRNCSFKTKDAFWHSENVTVYDSYINGEYLGWYSKNLKLVDCTISGTQPLCYADGLVLENCTMTDCDLAFEKSEVNATICGNVDSVKNPKCGRIVADNVEQVISEDFRERCTELVTTSNGARIII